jgi:serine/threonine protein kinase
VSIGPYRIVRRLGQGGMGTVYLAEDQADRSVAVKVINADLAGDPVFCERFRREVQAARRVRRFCTAPVLDASVETPPLYVVTEYINGETLDERVASAGPLQGSDLEGVAVGIATALSAIHDAGLVHRDLKPSNVLLSSTGPRVIDFGIARALDADTGVTRTGQIVGTPAYIAPEVITGKKITAAADVFSWACVVAFAGQGRPPFEGPNLMAILHSIAYGEPDLRGFHDPSLLGLVQRGLSKDPLARPTVPELLDRLAGRAAFVQQQPTYETAPPAYFQGPGTPPAGYPSTPQPTGPVMPRSRSGAHLAVAAGAAAVAMVVALALVLVITKGNGGTPRATDPADLAGGSKRTATSAASGVAGKIESRFVGTWTGMITQPGSPNSPYPTLITIASGGRLTEVVGTSAYSTLSCKGDLKLIDSTKAKLVVEEHITDGSGCTSLVVLTLTYRSSGSLNYSFRAGNSRGYGVLKKS